MAVLDSSALIEILLGTKKGEEIKRIIREEGASITSISIHEVMMGARPHEWQEVREFLESFEIIPFEEKAAFKSVEIEEALMKKGRPIGKLDCMIAAVCLILEVPLITADSDFSRVEGLTVISP